MSSPITSRPLPTEGPSAGGDEFDDLFDYDGDINDPFSENYVVPQSKDTTNNTSKELGSKGKSAAGLGIDEEIEVTRKPRAPRVKLDEHRLLSKNGIPKLRKKAKNLKFKGKGHEYSDASRLLAFYQLWLDDLFPKARFLDALAMVEKMGHKKMMQNARMEWINEGKPHSGVHEDSLFDEPELPARPREKSVERATAGIFERAQEGAREKETTPVHGTAGDSFSADDDLYDATPRPTRTQPATTGGGTSLFGPAKGTLVEEADGPPEDDLDALLAQEQSLVAEQAPPATRKSPEDDLDDDDLDALLAEQEMQTDKPALAASKAPPPQQTGDFDADMEEAMAEMDGLWD
ncbi:Chromosome segregation in meiosis protein [Lachnellula occidentalis]|uniref:Chromosome segregation in meiosis protein n=1 Tax=Lachnellula occidentalis TaxID=215460 RepID=A0A8H8S261_9HELO|nr:Chromosome segregation in meiosis protein [Lachnellula occidentalis]